MRINGVATGIYVLGSASPTVIKDSFIQNFNRGVLVDTSGATFIRNNVFSDQVGTGGTYSVFDFDGGGNYSGYTIVEHNEIIGVAQDVFSYNVNQAASRLLVRYNSALNVAGNNFNAGYPVGVPGSNVRDNDYR